MNDRRNILANACVLLALFLLPWQTRWIVSQGMMGDTIWEYGTLSVYAVEIVVFLAALLRGKPQLFDKNKKVAYVVGVLVLVAFLSALLSSDRLLGIHAVFHLFTAGIFFLLMLDDRTHLRKCGWAFVLGLLGPSVLGWMQTLTGHGFGLTVLGLAPHDAQELGVAVVQNGGERLLRAYGSFPHPNVFGGFLAMGILLFLMRTGKDGFPPSSAFAKASADRRLPIVLYYFLLATLSATLVITFSRSAWLALALGLVAFIFTRRVALARRGLFGVIVCLSAFLLTAFFFSSAVFSRFQPSSRLESISIETRTNQYREFPAVFFKNPITGVGPGAYTSGLARAIPGQPGWAYQPIHNVFLLILAELGVIGLAAFCWLLFRGFYRKFTSSDLTPSGSSASLGGVFFSSVIILLFLDHYLWTLWSGFALLVFVFVLMRRESDS